jgi:hypothetical protein
MVQDILPLIRWFGVKILQEYVENAQQVHDKFKSQTLSINIKCIYSDHEITQIYYSNFHSNEVRIRGLNSLLARLVNTSPK